MVLQDVQWLSMREHIFDLTSFVVFSRPLKCLVLKSNTWKSIDCIMSLLLVLLWRPQFETSKSQIWTLTLSLIFVIKPALKWPAFRRCMTNVFISQNHRNEKWKRFIKSSCACTLPDRHCSPRSVDSNCIQACLQWGYSPLSCAMTPHSDSYSTQKISPGIQPH